MTGDWVLGIASPEDFWIGFAMGVLVMLATVQIYSVLRYNYKRNIERRASQLFEEWKKEPEGRKVHVQGPIVGGVYGLRLYMGF